MTGAFFQRVVVPVASEDDARATVGALLPYLDSGSECIIAVHVIEKAGGALDKASVEQREGDAVDIFEAVRDGLAGREVDLETEVRYGTDVAETILDTAREEGATAIAFTPRGGSRWIKLLSGDVTTELVSDFDIPIAVLPDQPWEDRGP